MIKGKGQVFLLGNSMKICDVDYTINEKSIREGQTRMLIKIMILDDYYGFVELKDNVLKTEDGKYLDITIINTPYPLKTSSVFFSLLSRNIKALKVYHFDFLKKILENSFTHLVKHFKYITDGVFKGYGVVCQLSNFTNSPTKFVTLTN